MEKQLFNSQGPFKREEEEKNKEPEFSKDILSKIGFVSTGLTILCFAIGTLILNNHLSTYNLVDFNLLKPHAVVVGITCLTFIIANIFYFTVYFRWDDLKKTSLIQYLFSSFYRYIYAVNVLFFFLYANGSIFNVAVDTFLSYKQYRIVVWGFFLSLIGFLIELGYTFKFYKARFILTDLVSYIGIASTFIFMMVFIKSDKYLNFFYFEGFLFVSICLPTVRRIYNVKYGSVIIDEPESVFTINKPEGGYEFLQILYWAFLAIFCFVSIVLIYSKTIFPTFSQSYGGGALDQVNYITETDTIEGKKVYETDRFVFVFLADSSISKIDWNDVKKIVEPKPITPSKKPPIFEFNQRNPAPQNL